MELDILLREILFILFGIVPIVAMLIMFAQMVFGKFEFRDTYEEKEKPKYVETQVTDYAFFKSVSDAYATLPESIRTLQDIPEIAVMDDPPEQLVREKNLPIGSLIMGVFIGLPRTGKSHINIQGQPNVIQIYRNNIMKVCTYTGVSVEDQVKRVVWHEIAHFLGNDEARVAELGL
jgi:predicted Zn-dependent protease with MMP-like domain